MKMNDPDPPCTAYFLRRGDFHWEVFLDDDAEHPFLIRHAGFLYLKAHSKTLARAYDSRLQIGATPQSVPGHGLAPGRGSTGREVFAVQGLSELEWRAWLNCLGTPSLSGGHLDVGILVEGGSLGIDLTMLPEVIVGLLAVGGHAAYARAREMLQAVEQEDTGREDGVLSSCGAVTDGCDAQQDDDSWRVVEGSPPGDGDQAVVLLAEEEEENVESVVARRAPPYSLISPLLPAQEKHDPGEIIFVPRTDIIGMDSIEEETASAIEMMMSPQRGGDFEDSLLAPIDLSSAGGEEKLGIVVADDDSESLVMSGVDADDDELEERPLQCSEIVDHPGVDRDSSSTTSQRSTRHHHSTSSQNVEEEEPPAIRPPDFSEQDLELVVVSDDEEVEEETIGHENVCEEDEGRLESRPASVMFDDQFDKSSVIVDGDGRDEESSVGGGQHTSDTSKAVWDFPSKGGEDSTASDDPRESEMCLLSTSRTAQEDGGGFSFARGASMEEQAVEFFASDRRLDNPPARKWAAVLSELESEISALASSSSSSSRGKDDAFLPSFPRFVPLPTPAPTRDDLTTSKMSLLDQVLADIKQDDDYLFRADDDAESPTAAVATINPNPPCPCPSPSGSSASVPASSSPVCSSGEEEETTVVIPLADHDSSEIPASPEVQAPSSSSPEPEWEWCNLVDAPASASSRVVSPKTQKRESFPSSSRQRRETLEEADDAPEMGDSPVRSSSTSVGVGASETSAGTAASTGTSTEEQRDLRRSADIRPHVVRFQDLNDSLTEQSFARRRASSFDLHFPSLIVKHLAPARKAASADASFVMTSSLERLWGSSSSSIERRGMTLTKEGGAGTLEQASNMRDNILSDTGRAAHRTTTGTGRGATDPEKRSIKFSGKSLGRSRPSVFSPEPRRPAGLGTRPPKRVTSANRSRPPNRLRLEAEDHSPVTGTSTTGEDSRLPVDGASGRAALTLSGGTGNATSDDVGASVSATARNEFIAILDDQITVPLAVAAAQRRATEYRLKQQAQKKRQHEEQRRLSQDRFTKRDRRIAHFVQSRKLAFDERDVVR